MENAYLIVGLGNPGTEYIRTRHNAGFMVLDHVADRWKAAWRHEKRFISRIARTVSGSRKVVLCEPQTFMNSSGEAVNAVATFYRVPVSQLLVVVDDADLPLGELRLRPGGGTGGHHGLESIQKHLSSQDYAR